MKNKHAFVLILYTIVLFIIPFIAIIYEPYIEPDTFDKIALYWKNCGSAGFLVIVLWVVIFGTKNR